MLLLRAGPLAPHAVVQRGLQPALAGLGGDGHQVPTGGLQHQREQRRHDATGVRSPKATHHLLPEGTFRRSVCVHFEEVDVLVSTPFTTPEQHVNMHQLSIIGVGIPGLLYCCESHLKVPAELFLANLTCHDYASVSDLN